LDIPHSPFRIPHLHPYPRMLFVLLLRIGQ
jgi:hypothetical protein